MNKAFDVNAEVTFDFAKYPGQAVTFDGVLCRSRYYPLIRKQGRRLGQSVVQVTPSSDQDSVIEFESWSLNKFLVKNNATQIDKRYPVVAVGSNADPQIIAKKIRDYNDKFGTSLNDVIPFVRATMTGFALGQLPRPSKGVFFPFSAYCLEGGQSSGSSFDVVITFLDRGQLDAVDITEPNYDRVQVDGSIYPLRIDACSPREESISNYILYWTKRGILTDAKARPIPVRMDQREIQRDLAQLAPHVAKQFRNWPNHMSNELDSEAFADSIYNDLSSLGLKFDAKLPVGVEIADTELLQMYESSISNRGAARGGTYVVRSTPLSDSKRIMPRVFVDRETRKALGTFAFVSFGAQIDKAHGSDQAPHLRGLVAKVSINPKPKETDIQGKNVVLVDQLIRNSIGVEIGESVRLSPARIRDSRIVDVFMGTRKFHVARQQTADIAVVEQSTCIMDATALKIIGAVDGDKIVIYGRPKTSNGRVPKSRVRVIEAQDRLELRRSLAGGDLNSRYPSTDTTMGVYPDIPWIFLDYDAASKLNIAGEKLQPLLIRVSRLSLISRYMRELFLGIVLGTMGSFYTVGSTEGESKTHPEIALTVIILTYFIIRFKISSETGAPSLWNQIWHWIKGKRL